MLKDVFTNILKNKNKMLAADKGSDFEAQIEKKLKEENFTSEFPMTKTRDLVLKEYLKSIKDTIQAKTGKTLIENTLAKEHGNQYKNFYIAQPYGSQDFPDFLVFTDNKIFSIESKFVSGSNGKPVWNGNLPKQDGIYIFGSYTKQDLTFFRGEDILLENERIKIVSIWNETNAVFKEWCDNYLNDILEGKVQAKYGFMPYIRQAYQQSETLNDDAILDFFNDTNKSENEQRLIKWIEAIDKEDEPD